MTVLKFTITLFLALSAYGQTITYHVSATLGQGERMALQQPVDVNGSNTGNNVAYALGNAGSYIDITCNSTSPCKVQSQYCNIPAVNGGQAVTDGVGDMATTVFFPSSDASSCYDLTGPVFTIQPGHKGRFYPGNKFNFPDGNSGSWAQNYCLLASVGSVTVAQIFTETP